MASKNSELLKKTLSKPELHNRWADRYYTGKNNRFYDMAFDAIKDFINLPDGSKFLDAGCGNGAHSIRLAERGFKVTASDFSDEALKLCKMNLEKSGYEQNVNMSKEDLLGLSFPSDTFDGVLCWGVLMHIPEVERAVSELARVVKPGGYLIICELNNKSLENRIRGLLKKIFLIKNTKDEKTARGLECWTETEAGFFLIRKTNMKWLIHEVEEKNYSLCYQRAAQFTELYSRISLNYFKYLIQSFNEIWFRYIRFAAPSLTQILIFRKNENQEN